jgi:hypothetical protein
MATASVLSDVSIHSCIYSSLLCGTRNSDNRRPAATRKAFAEIVFATILTLTQDCVFGEQQYVKFSDDCATTALDSQSQQ